MIMRNLPERFRPFGETDLNPKHPTNRGNYGPVKKGDDTEKKQKQQGEIMIYGENDDSPVDLPFGNIAIEHAHL